MKTAKSILLTTAGLVVALTGASLEAQWLPQPATGSGPIYYNGGNVGVGTSNPLFPFHVIWNANSTNSGITFQNLSSGSSASAGIQALNDTGVSTSFGTMSSTKSTYGALVANSGVLYTPSAAGLVIMVDNAAGPIKFTAGGSAEKMRIDNTGNVGVGTSAPISRLQVSGNLSVGSGASAGVPGTAQITNDGVSPIANRLAFGTDGTGWEFAISKNQSGAVTDLVTVHDNGNVGIGTTTPPGQKLVIAGNAQLSTGGSLYGNTTSQALSLNSGNGSKLSYDANNYVLVGGNIITFGNNPGEAMRIYNGKLGIGVAPALPSSSLQVAGDVRLGSNGTNTDLTIFTDTPATLNGTAYTEVNTVTPVTVPAAGQTTRTALHLKNATASGQGTNQIDLVVDGTISGASVIGATYQDVAEWVRADAELAPATVVVLDPAHDDQVMPSTTAYDTTVAGVVSANPGVILGVGAAGKAKIATTGRVKVKVDASRASIAIGDLLVSSDIPGTAMKSLPLEIAGAKIHRPGTVIGKALQPLAEGTGEILVLLSLQ